MEKILIDFTKLDYSDSAPFKKSNDETEVLHMNSFHNTLRLINETLIHLEQLSNRDKEIKRLHNTISILGSRGSGKTSFLMSLREEINMRSTSSQDIQFLDIIDPTLIETKEHIFVNIVSRIEVLIRKDIENKRLRSSFNNSITEYERWEKSLSDLSGSIPSIDGVGKNNLYDEWEDSDYILEKGLERANAANNLEINFNVFLKQSLDLLGKKLFIIAFDDVDTDFTKGWEILECIRKYLTSPIVLPIISGDISLYSFLVRKKQWNNLDKDIMALEDKKNYYIQMVDHLESQYMLKVLKPENRITLTSLYEKISKENIPIYIRLKENGDTKDVEIRKMYADMIDNIGIHHNVSEVSALFLTYPIRTQIRIIKTWIDSINNNSNFSPHLLDIFWSDIATHYNHPDEFNREGMLNNIPLMGLLYQTKKIKEAAQFLPFTDSPSLNNALLAVGANFNNLVESRSYLIFDYWARIGALIDPLQDLSYVDKENQPSVKGLVEHAQLLSDIGIRKQSSLIASYLCATKILRTGVRSIQSDRDLISLYSFGSKKKPKDNVSRLNECLKAEDTLVRALGYLPLVGVRYENSLNPVYSFSILLASLAELLQEKNNIEVFEVSNETTLYFKLLKLSQYREFPLPDFLDATHKKQMFQENEDDDDSDLGVSHNPGSFDHITSFLYSLEEWINSYNGGASIHLLGRIATRFYISVQRIRKSDQLGAVFNRYLVLFFNSVLVEDAIEHDVFISEFNNPINENSIFMNNFRSCFGPGVAREPFSKNRGKLKLSEWIMSCPLFHYYLDPIVSNIILTAFSKPKIKSRLYEILSGVNIRKPEYRKEEKTELQSVLDAQTRNMEYMLASSERNSQQQLNEMRKIFELIIDKQEERSRDQNREMIERIVNLLLKKQ